MAKGFGVGTKLRGCPFIGPCRPILSRRQKRILLHSCGATPKAKRCSSPNRKSPLRNWVLRERRAIKSVFGRCAEPHAASTRRSIAMKKTAYERCGEAELKLELFLH